jgi:hypothetical protein
MSQYRDMWDIDVVLDYIRKATPLRLLPRKRLKARVAWILMVFLPLRMSALWRLDPTTERKSRFRDALEVDTREKTDTLRSKTVAVIRPLQDKRLCPVTHYLAAKNGALNRGAVGTLFCTDGGKPYVITDTVRHGVENQMYEAGISKLYKANTTRHAAFSALLQTMTEQQVNAFSGHSHRAHTLLNYCYHMDQHHAVQQLANMTAKGDKVQAVPEKVQEILQRDDEEGRLEETDQVSTQNPFEVQGSLASEERAAQAGDGDAGLLMGERENPIDRDEIKEVVCGERAAPAALHASFFEHEGSSSTLVNVSIPGSLNVREGGSPPTLFTSMGVSSPPSI